jgi:hypothetical protein
VAERRTCSGVRTSTSPCAPRPLGTLAAASASACSWSRMALDGWYALVSAPYSEPLCVSHPTALSAAHERSSEHTAPVFKGVV